MKRISILIIFLSILFNSFSQVDTLDNRPITSWKYDEFGKKHIMPVDTLLPNFHSLVPLYKQTTVGNYTGNYASPYQSMVFFDRLDDTREFFFYRTLDAYLHKPLRNHYFDTPKPYTQIEHSAGGPRKESEQILRVLHSQNRSQYLNIGLLYDLYSSKGRYTNHSTTSSLFTLFGNYEKESYSFRANVNFNNIEQGENGGIDSLAYLDSDEFSKSINVPVQLVQDSRSQLKNTSAYFEHGITLNFGERKRKKILKLRKEQRERQLSYKKQTIKEIDPDTTLSLVDPMDSLTVNIDSGLMESQDSINIAQSDSVEEPSIIEGKVDPYYYEPDAPNVSMSSIAKTVADREERMRMKEDSAYIAQIDRASYTSISLKHRFIYEENLRKYVDESPDDDYYDPYPDYIIFDKVQDESFTRTTHNKIYLDYASKNLDIQVGYSNYWTKFKFNENPYDTITRFETDTTYLDTIDYQYNRERYTSNCSYSYALKGKIFDHFYYSSHGEYYFNGWKGKENDLNFSGKAGFVIPGNEKLGSIWVGYDYSNMRSDYFQERYTSNYFAWDTSFKSVKKSVLSLEYLNKSYDLKVGAKYGSIQNYLYFNEDGISSQFDSTLNILELYLVKNIHWRGFHLLNTLKYQLTDRDDILAIPDFITHNTWYFEYRFNFKSTGGTLLSQYGIDFRYFTKYNADRYMPMTGVFYNQNRVTIGNYPFMDVFLNFTLRSFRFSFIYSNVFQTLLEPNYYTSPYYPAPPATLKFKVAWTFYD